MNSRTKTAKDYPSPLKLGLISALVAFAVGALLDGITKGELSAIPFGLAMGCGIGAGLSQYWKLRRHRAREHQ